MTPNNRRHTRFSVYEGAIAALRPCADVLGPIIDISLGGLSFRYIGAKASHTRESRLIILFPGEGYFLDHVPIETIADLQAPNPLSFSELPIRRRCVEFGSLTTEQAIQLRRFIQRYARHKRLPCAGSLRAEPAYTS